ncbi:MAG: NACHT domain-containing protein [Saprospiraceae bacterium]|nr:NACHT domain-containing protein [Candidatus Vicinibacter affinis]
MPQKLFDIGLIGLTNAITRINKSGNFIKIRYINPNKCIEFVAQHLQEESLWATQVSFRDSQQAKSLESIFIDLDLFVSPIKLRIETTESIDKIPSSTLLASSLENIILLGQPGAGKTTSVKKIFVELILKKYETYKTFNFPLIIRLKDFNHLAPSRYILFEAILNKLGFFIESISLPKNDYNSIFEHIFKDFIERLSILLILDGFDEISNKEIKTDVIENLRLISKSLTNSKFILTSRSADYNVFIENSVEYELCSLTHDQVELFVNNWIIDKSKPHTIKLALDLFEKLKKSPYWDTTIRPLTLAHLCALQERNHSIPDKAKINL